jgi:hypothetical protein
LTGWSESSKFAWGRAGRYIKPDFTPSRCATPLACSLAIQSNCQPCSINDHVACGSSDGWLDGPCWEGDRNILLTRVFLFRIWPRVYRSDIFCQYRSNDQLATVLVTRNLQPRHHSKRMRNLVSGPSLSPPQQIGIRWSVWYSDLGTTEMRCCDWKRRPGWRWLVVGIGCQYLSHWDVQESVLTLRVTSLLVRYLVLAGGTASASTCLNWLRSVVRVLQVVVLVLVGLPFNTVDDVYGFPLINDRGRVKLRERCHEESIFWYLTQANKTWL